MINSQLTMTIGAVSRATGIPVNTLRTWERRYSFPLADRSEGGQRLYSPSVIPHLKLINQALQTGLRPKQVVGMDFDELQELLGKNLPPNPTEQDEVQEWINAAKRLDGGHLDYCFHSSVSQLGVQRFLTDKIVPFIQEMGESWAKGKIQIYHEHFATERIHDFLTSIWRPLSDRAKGSSIICATLPGENHFLGLHMAATIMALYGYHIIFLGPKTPLNDLQECTWQSNAKSILISVSTTTPKELVTNVLKELRANLSSNVQIVLGGKGAPFIKGTVTMKSLNELSTWAIQSQKKSI